MTRCYLLALAACSSAPAAPLRIDSADPDHGPLGGGTRIVLVGDRFVDDDAGSTRVLVGGRQAELAAPIDDETIELVLPPGERPGEAELVVFNNHGVAISTSAFRYADVPAISAVTPPDVLAAGETQIVVTGSGFRDDGAGTPTVYLDGAVVEPVTVASDTELSFTAPSGRALLRPRLEIENARGVAIRERAFRYRPSMRPGLLLFARSSATFATFFDPVDGTLVEIPRVSPQFASISSVVLDEDGEYRGVDPHSLVFGRYDLSTQQLAQTIGVGAHATAIARIDGMQYAIDRNTLRFGKFGQDGVFTPIGTAALPCCGSYGLAYDGATVFFTSRTGGDKFINTIDRVTGAVGTPVKLVGSAGLHVEEMRFFSGKLYATSRDSTLVEIDPATGMTTVIAAIVRANAMEVLP